MEIVLGVFILALLIFSLAMVMALFDDFWAKRISARLLARAEARVAYRAAYKLVLAERAKEFGLPERPSGREGRDRIEEEL